MTAEPLPTVDGRRARRDQNRERVVDALLELYRGGNLEPSVAAVAECSGVSHRSVFRYFDDLDELYRVAIERQLGAVSDHLRIHEIGRGSLADRIERIVENRLTLYDLAAPVSRVGHMKAPVEPVLAANIADNAALGVEQVQRHFAPELDALEPAAQEPIAEAAAALVSMENLEFLRSIRGLDRAQTADVLTTGLRSLVGASS